LSAAASQARLIVVAVLLIVRRFDGALGGSVSLAGIGGVGVGVGGVGAMGGTVGVVENEPPAMIQGR
jgi:hypothetical protein